VDLSLAIEDGEVGQLHKPVQTQVGPRDFLSGIHGGSSIKVYCIGLVSLRPIYFIQKGQRPYRVSGEVIW
jgi:hypothetical protein